MRILFAVCALGGAAALGGCAALDGTVDDGGRAYRAAAEAEVDANLEPLAAQPTLVLSDRIPLRGADRGASSGTPPSACEAERFQNLIGMTAAQVEAERLPELTRVLEWGSMYTQDYQPERLNVHLDQNGRAYRVLCG